MVVSSLGRPAAKVERGREAETQRRRDEVKTRWTERQNYNLIFGFCGNGIASISGTADHEPDSLKFKLRLISQARTDLGLVFRSDVGSVAFPLPPPAFALSTCPHPPPGFHDLKITS